MTDAAKKVLANAENVLEILVESKRFEQGTLLCMWEKVSRRMQPVWVK